MTDPWTDDLADGFPDPPDLTWHGAVRAQYHGVPINGYDLAMRTIRRCRLTMRAQAAKPDSFVTLKTRLIRRHIGPSAWTARRYHSRNMTRLMRKVMQQVPDWVPIGPTTRWDHRRYRK